MLHAPAAPAEKDPAATYKTRLGIWMFLFYLAFYGVFVGINVFRPMWMGRIIWRGLNLATLYGFSLIIIALLQALAYDALCRAREYALKKGTEEGKR